MQEATQSTHVTILEKYFKNSKQLQDDYVSSKIKASEDSYKAVQLISKDEVVYAFSGRIVPHQYLHFYDPEAQKRKIQFREGIYSVPLFKPNSRDLLKHSNTPNCGIQHQVFFVAIEDIQPGEKITYDQAMVGGPYPENESKSEDIEKYKPKDWEGVLEKYGKYCSTFIKNRALGTGKKEYGELPPLKKSQIPTQEFAVLAQYIYSPEMQSEDFISVKCNIELNKEMEGQQLRAAQNIPKGRHVSSWGGRFFKDIENEEDVNHAIQIHDYLYEGPLRRAVSESDSINHSCDANLGMSGPVTLVAMRDIEAGELLTFDYCMTDFDDIDTFDCLCKSSNCRGKVGVQQWKNKEIQEKYKGYFSSYIQSLIDKL